MAPTDVTDTPTDALPHGRWRVDRNASELGFKARGAFGLVPVRGTFREFDGTLEVDEAGARGDLVIQAASLDTGMGTRDKHLRSADFFHVEEHPAVTFSLTEVTRAAGGLTLTGRLQIRETGLNLVVPLEATQAGADRLHLRTTLSVERAAAGVGWSKLGMVQGKAHLHVALVLTRES
jgi:polyisoprenoid-binding protein YceI